MKVAREKCIAADSARLWMEAEQPGILSRVQDRDCLGAGAVGGQANLKHCTAASGQTWSGRSRVALRHCGGHGDLDSDDCEQTRARGTVTVARP